MDRSTMSNKMINLRTEDKKEYKFTVEMHGFRKDQIVRYSSVPDSVKTLIRRRLADNDGSVIEVTKTSKSPTQMSGESQTNNSNNSNTSKPTHGKGAKQNKPEEDS